MGRNIKNGFEKTAANIDSGARTIANIPLLIIEKICEIIMRILYLFRIWVIFPIVMIFAFFEVYVDPRGGARDHFELSDFLSYCRFLFLDQVNRGQLLKTIALGALIAFLIYALIYVIRVHVFGSILTWANYHHTQNNGKIEYNNDKVRILDNKSKYSSKRDQLKDELKDFRNSDEFEKR